MGDLPPYDRGLLHAHQLAAGLSAEQLEAVRARARRDRARLWTRLLLPWRRRFLDGLLRGLERELGWRAADARNRDGPAPRP